MRKGLTIVLLCGAMMIAPGFVRPARASLDWFSIGGAFRVGAAHIAFVFGRPSFGYGYGPAYYYRYDQPISYRGYHCSRYCFRDGPYFYHHESCPLVAFHFSTYGIDPYQAYGRYAPPYGGYPYNGFFSGFFSYGYGGRGYYDDRYDRGYHGRGSYDRGYYDRGYHDRGYYDRGHYDRRYDDRYDRRGHGDYDRRDDRRGHYDRRDDHHGRHDRDRHDHGHDHGRDHRHDHHHGRGHGD